MRFLILPLSLFFACGIWVVHNMGKISAFALFIITGLVSSVDFYEGLSVLTFALYLLWLFLSFTVIAGLIAVEKEKDAYTGEGVFIGSLLVGLSLSTFIANVCFLDHPRMGLVLQGAFCGILTTLFVLVELLEQGKRHLLKKFHLTSGL